MILGKSLLNNLAWLGASIAVGGGGTLIYRGLIEQHPTPTSRFLEGRLGNRFMITEDYNILAGKIEEYNRENRTYLRIPGLGTTRATETDQNTNTNFKSNITAQELWHKCHRMRYDGINKGLKEVHWLLFRHWCTNDKPQSSS